MYTNYVDSSLIIDNPALIEPGRVRWKSPSNIAIVKYWGKHGRQLPRNPSLSLTLNSAFTDTTVAYIAKEEAVNDQTIDLDFYFEGKKNEAFSGRIARFMTGILPIFPFLGQLKLEINSENSFPHSSGIASSASSMSALALCICSIEQELSGRSSTGTFEEFMKKASFIARLGSGSACRSICGQIGVWGNLDDIFPEASDLFAVPFTDGVHTDFLTMHDDILIISGDQKHVSSSAGHALMEGNVYAQARFSQAENRVGELLEVLRTGDLDRFGEITESEALTLHALMMSSQPAYLLLKPNTLTVINKVWDFRKSHAVPLFFSLDAGPNLHLLYPHRYRETIESFIDTELRQFCEDGRILKDWVGKGPVKLN